MTPALPKARFKGGDYVVCIRDKSVTHEGMRRGKVYRLVSGECSSCDSPEWVWRVSGAASDSFAGGVYCESRFRRARQKEIEKALGVKLDPGRGKLTAAVFISLMLGLYLGSMLTTSFVTFNEKWFNKNVLGIEWFEVVSEGKSIEAIKPLTWHSLPHVDEARGCIDNDYFAGVYVRVKKGHKRAFSRCPCEDVKDRVLALPNEEGWKP
jgi:hypothetical protein